jgi:hypothetical protein
MGDGWDDFTEDSYRGIIRAARERYSFESFGTEPDRPHVLWRHDVDFSVHRALRLAEIEADEGVRSTYFLLLHGVFYNLLEAPVFQRARRLLDLGHDLGLHFDVAFYGGFADVDELTDRIAHEADVLSEFFKREISAFSFHNTTVLDGFAYADLNRVAGLINTNGQSLMERYSYVSDSNCYWRFRRLPDVIDDGTDERLQVLTHPECWQREAMSPRARIVRCMQGRGEYMMDWYDELLAAGGRENIGLSQQ